MIVLMLITETFIERYKSRCLQPPGVSIVLVDTYWAGNSEEIDDLYGQYNFEGYEGQMIRQDTAYPSKRTKDLLKRKEFITEEYKVVEVHEGQGNWAG